MCVVEGSQKTSHYMLNACANVVGRRRCKHVQCLFLDAIELHGALRTHVVASHGSETIQTL